jgi:CRISPR/Cas system CSM-associated protein Csm3 (group 7 of RAMP superfamily)
MSKRRQFDRYKIVFKGNVRNMSPLIIGGGGDEQTDSDVLKDKKGYPFIPGTSFAGVIRHHFEKYYSEFVQIEKYFGYSKGEEGEGSKIIFSDLISENDADIQIRNGIRIDNATGIVEDRGKFDFEVIEPDAKFAFRIEIGGNDKNELMRFIATIKKDIKEKRIAFGAKTNLGFGKIELVDKDSNISLYDLENKNDILKWLKKSDNKIEENLSKPYKYKYDSFRIEFDFVIKDSFIVRHYSNDPSVSDSVHIKSCGKNIIPGTSIKGAIRARAEKILNTLKINDRYELFDFLFGNSSKNNKVNSKKYNGSIPSRIKINEVIIKQNVEASIQQRIKTDRFTGGTINGALFDSMPVFANDYINTNKLIMELKNPIDSEIGLVLLILKDLWTEDLAIGGEKSVGRGVLMGKRVVILYKDMNVVIDDINSVFAKDKNKLQKYVDALNNADFTEYLSKMKSIYYNEEAINE